MKAGCFHSEKLSLKKRTGKCFSNGNVTQIWSANNMPVLGPSAEHIHFFSGSSGRPGGAALVPAAAPKVPAQPVVVRKERSAGLGGTWGGSYPHCSVKWPPQIESMSGGIPALLLAEALAVRASGRGCSLSRVAANEVWGPSEMARALQGKAPPAPSFSCFHRAPASPGEGCREGGVGPRLVGTQLL